MTLVRRYVICAVMCAVLRNSSRTRRVRSRYMRDARPSLFIFAVLSAVLRSGFRDTVYGLFAPGNESAEERKGLESIEC